MNAKRSGMLLLTFAVISMSVGCGASLPFVDPRLSDGGGGDLLSAGFKIIQGDMTSLTQDEVQQLSDQVVSAIRSSDPKIDLPSLTNAQADLFVAFLKANSVPGSATSGLNSIDDIQAFIEAAAADPSIIVIPPGLEEAFGGMGDIEDLFSSVIGGA